MPFICFFFFENKLFAGLTENQNQPHISPPEPKTTFQPIQYKHYQACFIIHMKKYVYIYIYPYIYSVHTFFDKYNIHILRHLLHLHFNKHKHAHTRYLLSSFLYIRILSNKDNINAAMLEINKCVIKKSKL